MRFFLFNDNMKLIVSSYQSGLGALTLFNIDNEVTKLSQTDLTEPSFVIVSGHLIFTYSKKPLTLKVFTIVNNRFMLIDELAVDIETLTHLAYDKKNSILYGASYKDGVVLRVSFKNAMFSDLKVLHMGGKCHCVTLVNDNVLVTNIEKDELNLLDKDLNVLETISLDKGIGPRHTIVKNDMYFVATEYSNELLMIKNGKIIDRIKTISDTSVSNCATLFIDNDKVYVSNRGEETISIFKYQPKLELVKKYSVFGLHSRHMILNEDKIISFNKNSDDITIINKETGKLETEIKFSKASCGAIYK